jgi:hypothetical protein
MKYVLINNAVDGTHESVHKTHIGAINALIKMLGWQVDGEIGRTYYSDWGNTLIIEERPDNWTASVERATREAYDARECGTATKRQLDLLDRNGF